LAACSQLVEAPLQTCSLLWVLITSREAFNITGETIWLIPLLRIPDTYHLPPTEGLLRFEAIHLFIERAWSDLHAFTLTPEKTPAVVQICRRLDGIPLAIELSAARIRLLFVDQIAARLDDTYRFLIRGSRTALSRQQTLRATIDWSYSLLSEQEQTVFRRLSVFAGGFTLDAVEVVCANESIEEHEILDVLSHLVDKSLVLMEERNAAARYRLLETIRQYGQDKLQQMGEQKPCGDKHRSWHHTRYAFHEDTRGLPQ
jgi:predicted ATPase